MICVIQTDLMKKLEEAGNPIEVWTDWDNGGVHTNSGVPNYAAYLMYKNGAFESKEEMAKVWYNSLYLMTTTSDFEDCTRCKTGFCILCNGYPV